MTKALRLNVQSGAAELKPRRAFAVFAKEADGRRHVYYHPQHGCQTFNSEGLARAEAKRLDAGRRGARRYEAGEHLWTEVSVRPNNALTNDDRRSARKWADS